MTLEKPSMHYRKNLDECLTYFELFCEFAQFHNIPFLGYLPCFRTLIDKYTRKVPKLLESHGIVLLLKLEQVLGVGTSEY